MAYSRNGSGKDVDLDLFLTAVESKLRGPFSSLDLTKTVTTPALRGDVTESEYLRNISQVLSKSDKISQMRILIGMLGLEPEPELDSVIFKILRQAQGSGDQDLDGLTEEERLAHRYEEWVRVVAGLIQGIMFKEDDENGSQSYGEEAKKLLDKTCDDIIMKVEQVADNASKQSEEESSSDVLSLITTDFDPLMAPYRYSLLNPDLLKETIPDAMGPNPHFTVNEDASILALDAKLEMDRAKEESERAQQKGPSQRTVSGSSDRSSGSAATPMAYMPGMNRKRKPDDTTGTTAKKKPAVDRPKTSMFMTKKPAATMAGGSNVKRTGLHVRKTGAAQRLVGKGRQLQTNTAAGSGGPGGINARGSLLGKSNAASRFGGRALKASAAGAGGRSKMKMIDDTEASSLAQQQDQPQQKLSAGMKRKSLLSSKVTAKAAKIEKNSTSKAEPRTGSDTPTKSPESSKPAAEQQPEPKEVEVPHIRESNSASASALAAAALSKYQSEQQQNVPTQSPPKQSPSPNPNPPIDDQNTANDLAAAALSKYQSKVAAANSVMAAPSNLGGEAAGAAASAGPRQLNWQKLLSTKSNRLTDQDRNRVQLFFEKRANPTPGERVYKMKLHEERTTDPSGKPVKETYYLELNYDNFTSKQSKKVKRYD